MSRRHWLLTGAVFVMTSIPYLFGYLRQTSERRFTGIVFDVVDTAQYFAWMRAFSHAALIANPLTPEEGASRFFNLQWWLLGLLAYDLPVGPVVAYQLLRLLALILFAITLARFCRIASPRAPFFAFAVVMLSSGLGWIWVVQKQWSGDLRHPLDVQVAEANSWFSAMAFPHLLVAAALLLAIFTMFVEWDTRRTFTRLAAIAGLALALGFSHGYDLIPAIVLPAATAGFLLLRDRKLPALAWPCAAIATGAALPALYTLALTRLDDTWRGVLSQYGNADVYTPAPPHLLVLLGVPFLLALWQLRPCRWAVNEIPQLFLRVWLVAGFALLYIPTDYQIKMLTAYQVPAGILAVQTLLEIETVARAWLPQRASMRAALPVLVLAVFALTNFYLTVWRMVDLRRSEYPYFISGSDVRALDALEGVVEPRDVVLSSPELGVFVPVYSDARPYVAHWAQTLRYFERRDNAAWFYALPTSDAERRRFLAANDIDYVIAGPAEAALNGRQLPLILALDAVVSGDTAIYRTPATGRAEP